MWESELRVAGSEGICGEYLKMWVEMLGIKCVGVWGR